MALVDNIPNSYIRITTFKNNDQLKEDQQSDLSGFASLKKFVTGINSSDLLFIPLIGVVTTIPSEGFGMLVLQYGTFGTSTATTNSKEEGETEDKATINLAFSEGNDKATVEFLVAGDLANATIKGLMMALKKIKTKPQRVKIDVITLGGEILWGYAFQSFNKTSDPNSDASIYTLELAKWKFNFNQDTELNITPVSKGSLVG